MIDLLPELTDPELIAIYERLRNDGDLPFTREGQVRILAAALGLPYWETRRRADGSLYFYGDVPTTPEQDAAVDRILAYEDEQPKPGRLARQVLKLLEERYG